MVCEVLVKVLGTAIRERLRAAGLDGVQARASFGVHEFGRHCASPSAVAVGVHLDAATPASEVLDLVERELRDLAGDGPGEAALRSCVRRERLTHAAALDSFLRRSRELALSELYGCAPVTDADLRSVTAGQVAAAARDLLRAGPISLELAPAGGRS